MKNDNSKEKELTKTVHVKISLHRKLRKVAADLNTNLSELTENALLKTYKKELEKY